MPKLAVPVELVYWIDHRNRFTGAVPRLNSFTKSCVKVAFAFPPRAPDTWLITIPCVTSSTAGDVGGEPCSPHSLVL